MATVHEYILWVTWSLLTLVPKMLKNPVHDMLYPTQDVLEDMLSKVTFAAGLIDVLLSSSPPTIDFFKSLPTHSKNLWGVYLILLEKASCRPKIYIGSSVKVAGMNTRFTSYNDGHPSPQCVQHTIDNGFTITYKGVLCWTTVPTSFEPIPNAFTPSPTRDFLFTCALGYAFLWHAFLAGLVFGRHPI